MISHPLPRKVALPPEVQNLFVHLFDRAAQQPSIATIRPIYQVLRGTSTLLLGLLSNNVLLRLEEHLFDILRNLKGDDQSLSLFCLAIMRTLARSTHELFTDLPVSSYDTQELLASTQATASTKWKPDTVQQFFTATKAQRTMQLVALRVMWACNASTGHSIDEKTESLRLANEIVTAVPVQEREAWRKANALLLKKFEEKVFVPSLDASIRFRALCFLARLTEGSTIPTAVLNSLREIIIKPAGVAEVLDAFDSESMQLIVSCGVLDENTTTTLFQNMVDFAVSAAPEDVLQLSPILIDFLRHLRQAMIEHDAIVDGIMLAFDVLSCGSKINSLARLVSSPPLQSSLDFQSGMCTRALQNARNGLIQELCSTALRAALASQHPYSISQDTVSTTLELYALTSQDASACLHSKSTCTTAHQTMTLHELKNSTDETTADWREALKSEISTRANAEYDRLTMIFARSCKELEERCANVEQPLHAALEEQQQLQARHDELQTVIDNLESEKIDRSLQFDALEAERDQAIQDAESLRADNDNLDATCRNLEREIAETVTKGERDVMEVKQLMETAALEHSTMLAKIEEDIEALEAQLDISNGVLQHEKEASEKTAAALEQLKTELASNEKELQLVKAASVEQQDSIDRLTEERDGLRKANEATSAKVATLNAELTDEREAHQDTILRLESQTSEKLTAADEYYKQELTDLTSAHDGVLHGLKRKIADLETESNQTKAHYLAEIERQEFDIREKQNKVYDRSVKCSDTR